MKAVIIFKNNEKLAQFPTIQKAAHFMKAELRRKQIPWSIVNKGIQHNISYMHTDGNVYKICKLSDDVNLKREQQLVALNTLQKSEFSRIEFIEFLSRNLEQIIYIKLQISDERLKQHHLSPKGLGDDLYYLTESFHRQKGLYNGKYSMTDFITPQALLLMHQKKRSN